MLFNISLSSGIMMLPTRQVTTEEWWKPLCSLNTHILSTSSTTRVNITSPSLWGNLLLPYSIDPVPWSITSLPWGRRDQLVQLDKGRVKSTTPEEAPALVYTMETTPIPSFEKLSAWGLAGEASNVSLDTFLVTTLEDSPMNFFFLFKRGTFRASLLFFHWSP